MHVNPDAGPNAYAGDSVIVMSPQDTSHHTPNRVIRVEPELWDAFTAAVKRNQPAKTKTDVIKEFLRWYVRERGARLPDRPERQKPDAAQ